MASETREIQQRILEECDRQYQSVRFTHEFGKWISQGINASRSAISSIPTDIEPLEFLRRAMRILDSVSHDVDNPNDEDGWTQGGVGTIRRFVMDERRTLERAQASSREGILDALFAVLFEAFEKERAEVLRRQASILLLDPLEATEPNRGVCSWCRKDSHATHRFASMRQICLTCCLLFYPNLVEASNGKQIPAIGMVIADVSRALRASSEPAAEKIIAELERRAGARRSRYPRGFLPACDGCTEAFERVQWTASLPGVDLCDRCIRHATEVLSFV